VVRWRAMGGKAADGMFYGKAARTGSRRSPRYIILRAEAVGESG
jgi:hypothetical protein